MTARLHCVEVSILSTNNWKGELLSLRLVDLPSASQKLEFRSEHEIMDTEKKKSRDHSGNGNLQGSLPHI